MTNGRWARFQKCRVFGSGQTASDEGSILIAVELEQRFQDLLNSAETSIEQYRRQGIPMRLRMDLDDAGQLAVLVEESTAIEFEGAARLH